MRSASAQPKVYLPALAAELSADWTVSERTIFRSPSGNEVHVRVDPERELSTSGELMHRRLGEAREDVGDLIDLVESEVDLGSRRRIQRSGFEFDRDGIRATAQLACWLDDGLAVTAVAVAADDSAQLAADVEELMGGLRLGGRPSLNGIPEVSSPLGPSSLSTPARPVDWARLRSAWSESGPVASPDSTPTTWSCDELAVVAMILGGFGFPTVDAELLRNLPDAAATVTAQAVARSLMARGVVSSDAEGTVTIADDVIVELEVAVRPALAVSITRVGRGTLGRWWLGVASEAAAQITVLPGDLRECRAIDPASLVERVLMLAGVADRSDGSGGEDVVVSLQDVVSGEGPVTDIVLIQMGWPIDGAVRGAELVWAIGADGRLYAGEPEEGAEQSWRCRAAGVATLRAEFASTLPGS